MERSTDKTSRDTYLFLESSATSTRPKHSRRVLTAITLLLISSCLYLLRDAFGSSCILQSKHSFICLTCTKQESSSFRQDWMLVHLPALIWSKYPSFFTSVSSNSL
ncbi:hypothetical protein GYMLUDRAFT_406989 [Collybiopsis luxurians FD-317 M1]|uniref:Unplaced genomic scaffold GYMLUscaffold_124, whole genome shotgun sequence n=1 Tax=Collybiopsis luxurians FD-317 M1 TaxID=944289 RepID=A0A0D0BA34_9AGAR|nr:hypothetical protein GYMLUDRAFT_406989 [Collybiopsis luxurians FD-317 M1]